MWNFQQDDSLLSAQLALSLIISLPPFKILALFVEERVVLIVLGAVVLKCEV